MWNQGGVVGLGPGYKNCHQSLMQFMFVNLPVTKYNKFQSHIIRLMVSCCFHNELMNDARCQAEVGYNVCRDTQARTIAHVRVYTDSGYREFIKLHANLILYPQNGPPRIKSHPMHNHADWNGASTDT